MYEDEKAEADDDCRVLNDRRHGQCVLDFRSYLVRSLKRSSNRKLQIDIQIALVFVGKKACRHFVPEPTRSDRESCKQDDCNCAFADEKTAHADVPLGGVGEDTIEPTEKRSERPTGGGLRTEQQCGQRRAQAQCVERRKDYGKRDGDRKLLIKASRDPRYEGGRNKDSRENQI